LTAHATATANFLAATGSPQSFAVAAAPVAVSVAVNNLPVGATAGGSFTPTYAYVGDGVTSVTSSTPAVCTVAAGLVSFVAAGTCTLTAHATATANFLAATGSPQSFAVAAAVLSARAAKQAVLAQLRALAPIDSATDKNIAKAIGDLQKSLDSSAWVDDNHLRKDGGSADSVFNEEKATVRELLGIKNPSAALAARIAGWINSLVAADRTLATTAISEGGSAGDLARANDELAMGDADRNAGRFENAIEHYKKAWKALNGGAAPAV
jgi:hypothetical protein